MRFNVPGELYPLAFPFISVVVAGRAHAVPEVNNAQTAIFASWALCPGMLRPFRK